MSDLISRQAALEAIEELKNRYFDRKVVLAKAQDAVNNLPTIGPVKHGRWIKHRDRTCWYCSECTTDDYYAYTWDCDTGEYEFQDNYCPNCGARMVEGKEG